MNSNLIDCQGQLLKFKEKEKQWKREMSLILKSEKDIKSKSDDLEKRLEEKERELQDK